MPSKRRACRIGTCPEAAIYKGYCELHAREQRRSLTSQAMPRRSALRDSGSTWRWRQIRALVLGEEPLCRPCKQAGSTVIATHVHHIVPREQGGSDHRMNLLPVCAWHSEKLDRERRQGSRGDPTLGELLGRGDPVLDEEPR